VSEGREGWEGEGMRGAHRSAVSRDRNWGLARVFRRRMSGMVLLRYPPGSALIGFALRPAEARAALTEATLRDACTAPAGGVAVRIGEAVPQTLCGVAAAAPGQPEPEEDEKDGRECDLGKTEPDHDAVEKK